MLSIMQLRAVGMACLFSVSVKVGFLAESALQFELMEKGVKKEQMLLLGLPLLAIEVWTLSQLVSLFPCLCTFLGPNARALARGQRNCTRPPPPPRLSSRSL